MLMTFAKLDPTEYVAILSIVAAPGALTALSTIATVKAWVSEYRKARK
jgi:hypothetical protein